MKISKECPAIYKKIKEHFPAADFNRGLIITYGDTVYCRIEIPDDFIIHEEVHIKQQEKYGKDEWWRRYFEDVQFRLKQEFEAYSAQAKYIRLVIKDFKQREEMIDYICQAISSPIYGNMIKYEDAKRII